MSKPLGQRDHADIPVNAADSNLGISIALGEIRGKILKSNKIVSYFTSLTVINNSMFAFVLEELHL